MSHQRLLRSSHWVSPRPRSSSPDRPLHPTTAEVRVRKVQVFAGSRRRRKGRQAASSARRNVNVKLFEPSAPLPDKVVCPPPKSQKGVRDDPVSDAVPNTNRNAPTASSRHRLARKKEIDTNHDRSKAILPGYAAKWQNATKKNYLKNCVERQEGIQSSTCLPTTFDLVMQLQTLNSSWRSFWSLEA